MNTSWTMMIASSSLLIIPPIIGNYSHPTIGVNDQKLLYNLQILIILLTMSRVVILLLDGVGIGALPDAQKYGDEGSNTLANLAQAVGGLKLPTFQKLGLGNIAPLSGVDPSPLPLASYGKMAEASPGKDSTTGHWEIAGIILDHPFPVYPDGFPDDVIRKFEERIGRKILGNVPASGTVIIEELGREHLKTRRPIVYTSADSVFQIAAHVDVIPIPELYQMCEIAREILTGRHQVARVIARPFEGKPGSFRRRPERKDFSLPPPHPTLLDRVKESGQVVVAIGKVDEIFAFRGITRSYHSVRHDECMAYVEKELKEDYSGLIFANFVQFDMDWGHRNNPAGFYQGLIDFDEWLKGIITTETGDDLFFITADHGNDPTTPSTDHSREYVPLLVFGRKVRSGIDLGTRRSFADLGQTAARYLEVEALNHGEDFLETIS